MAFKGSVYGLSRECEVKTRAKFDMERALIALQWVEDVTGRQLLPDSGEFHHQAEVAAVLKDGAVLCELMNRLKPGSVKKINQQKLAFKQMENIEVFLKACREYGMNEVDVFQTQDLYECKSMYTVVNCLHALGSLARKNNFEGPTVGVKLADKNERSFSEEKLAEGRTLIGLQYGSPGGASQKGMTPYGKPRQILS